jgi:Transmembrane amino acid transporter protein
MQEAMMEPQRMMGASVMGFAAVAVTYAGVGLGLLLLYPYIDGDVLQELPMTGILPTAVRLAMVVVVMVTAPLLVVPCGELIEGKIFDNTSSDVPASLRALVRLGICVICSFISVWVPGFVDVLSFVGCFCVALVSFVVPPLLHFVLLRSAEPPNTVLAKRAGVLDVVMLAWGISAVILTSLYTFRNMGSV